MSHRRILLVEDEDFKRRHITQFLQGTFPHFSVDTARSVTAAIEELDKKLPDVVLLDMSLPTFDIGEFEGGGRPQGFGGIEVVRHMKFSELECPVVVVTGYEAFPKGTTIVNLAALESDLRDEFPDLIHGVLYFNSVYEDWKQILSDFIIEAIGNANDENIDR